MLLCSIPVGMQQFECVMELLLSSRPAWDSALGSCFEVLLCGSALGCCLGSCLGGVALECTFGCCFEVLFWGSALRCPFGCCLGSCFGVLLCVAALGSCFEVPLWGLSSAVFPAWGVCPDAFICSAPAFGRFGAGALGLSLAPGLVLG